MLRTVARGVAMLAALMFAIVAALWFVATQPWVSTIDWEGERASAATLERHVNHLALGLPGRSDDIDALNMSAAYIFSEFQRYGRPHYETFGVWGIEYRNVVLELGAASGPSITVGAHYDAFRGLPGADDNASGVAGLLELARLLKAAQPKATVELVAYALEEPPYFATQDMGSFRHASTSEADFTIILEMIGYFSDRPGSQTYPVPLLNHVYPDRGNFIALIGRLDEIGPVRTMKGAFSGASSVPTVSLTFPPIVPGVTFSDHRNYWEKGQRAIMVTDTAFQRNPYYHTPQDTPEKLDYNKMAEVVTGVYAALFALATRL